MRPVRTGSGPSQIGTAEVYTGPGWKYWPVIKSYYNLLFIKVIYIRVDNGGKETLDRSDFEFGYTLGKLTYRPDSRPGEILSSAQQTDRVRPAWNIFFAMTSMRPELKLNRPDFGPMLCNQP